MKAISLWQPWASAMALGLKHNETRSRPTYITGDVAICAAARKPTADEKEQVDLVAVPADELPLGVIVCVVEIVGCVSTEHFTRPTGQFTCSQTEAALGDYRPNRFVWLTRNTRKLKTPIPIKARQGWFNLPSEVETLIVHQLGGIFVKTGGEYEKPEEGLKL